MEERKTNLAPKDSILDRNLSWPLMFVYIGYLVGIFFGLRASFNYTYDYTMTAYFLISFFGGLVLSFVIYCIGKIVMANLTGYKVFYMTFLGIVFDYSTGTLKLSYDISLILSLGLQFAPKDDDVTKNPKKMLFGGAIAEGIVVLVCLALFFILYIPSNGKSIQGNIGLTLLFGMLFGLITTLYEMIPLRQDSPTDMFSFLSLKTEDDIKAFNITQINKKREMSGLDFIVPEFEDYGSYYKTHTLYAKYLSNIYNQKLDQAFEVLNDMRYFSKYYDESETYLVPSEQIYLKYLINDNEGADKIYLTLKGDNRKAVISPYNLSEYRTALLIIAYINNDAEKIAEVVKDFNATLNSYAKPLSNRAMKEARLFTSAYQKIKKDKETFNLPELEITALKNN